MKKKVLIQTLLKAVTYFLDQEWELGFLTQAQADKIVTVEDMLTKLLNENSSQTRTTAQVSAVSDINTDLRDDTEDIESSFPHKREEQIEF